MNYIFNDKDRKSILDRLEPEYNAPGIIEACNHCFDDCVDHRVTVLVSEDQDFAHAAAIVVMSKIEVPHELS